MKSKNGPGKNIIGWSQFQFGIILQFLFSDLVFWPSSLVFYLILFIVFLNFLFGLTFDKTIFINLEHKKCHNLLPRVRVGVDACIPGRENPRKALWHCKGSSPDRIEARKEEKRITAMLNAMLSYYTIQQYHEEWIKLREVFVYLSDTLGWAKSKGTMGGKIAVYKSCENFIALIPDCPFFYLYRVCRHVADLGFAYFFLRYCFACPTRQVGIGQIT